ncbi:hypothetical protein QAD02_000042 [Eretmocerus hayati]|uniref:Uncharacterized protein n=1 Tax=Eretmocerus hayati TaxID=131215 RepID=A0ACC2NCH5_9HYME|nr:hypothetical protein QAD02_000042 [Eretmocerus hayati]
MRNSSTRGQNARTFTVSEIDPSKITPEQLKKVTKSIVVPRIISDVVVLSQMRSVHKNDENDDIISEGYIVPTQNAQSLKFNDEIGEICDDSSSVKISPELDRNIVQKLLSSPHDKDSVSDAQNNNSTIFSDVEMENTPNEDPKIATKFFETQAITTYKLLGKLEEIPVDAGIWGKDFDTVAHTQGIICIGGVVKDAPRLQNSDIVGNKVVGGITNGLKLIEINSPEDQKVNHILKGETMKVIGAILKESCRLHVIKVSDASDIRMPRVIITDLQHFLNARSYV